MITYVDNAIRHFNHEKPRKLQHQTYPHTKPVYTAKAQFSEQEDMSEILSQSDKKFIQEVIGKSLYYSWTVDTTMLTSLGSTASQQTNPTVRTM